MRFRVLLVLALFALAGGSHARAAARAAAPATKQLARPSAPRLTDAQMEGVLRAKLAKSKLNADHLSVHVHNGVVTWEGKTNVIQHKGAATRMAHTAGATTVVNNIQITEEARRKAAERLAMARTGRPVEKATVTR